MYIYVCVRVCVYVVVQSLSHVRLSVTPWTATSQAPLSFTLFQSLLKLMSIESVMLSNHLILCHPFSFGLQSFSSIRVCMCVCIYLSISISISIYGEGNGTPLQYSCLDNPMDGGACWAAVHGIAKSRTRLSNFTFNFHFHALEKEMATHSSVLAWRIPGMAEPGGLPSMGSHRVGHD